MERLRARTGFQLRRVRKCVGGLARTGRLGSGWHWRAGRLPGVGATAMGSRYGAFSDRPEGWVGRHADRTAEATQGLAGDHRRNGRERGRGFS